MNMIGEPIELSHPKKWWQFHKRRLVFPGRYILISIEHNNSGVIDVRKTQIETTLTLIDESSWIYKNEQPIVRTFSFGKSKAILPGLDESSS